ncbi:hypothetical protein OIE66_42330 [Nonomuraea sp. NBC_01738]|uniref:hypothetical protein n=1 Tax=Nonomuraea sp. NBC_01738 TaxID=2976003 RepID=UPI002E13DDEB|nr:hypothetical protein OIE66_42330 [Nonomuraea sp. NBC_01738]
MTLGPDSVVTASHLVVTKEDDDEYVVGDPGTGVFFSVPGVGARLVELFAEGRTVAQAEEVLLRETGEEIDALDFAADLIAAGVVPELDGLPAPERRERRVWVVSRVPARLLRPFFGPVAWTLYGLSYVASIAIFVAQPGLVPTYEDVFFTTNIPLCLIVAVLGSTLLAFLHEIWHAFAGAAMGITSRFRIGLRAYFPVFETDLTGIWSVPPRRRYGAFLSGMAIDGVLLLAALLPRYAWSQGWLDPSPLLMRLLAYVVLVQVIKTIYQGLAFLRTDLYFVLLTATGTRNLHQVTKLGLKRMVRSLSPAEAAVLAGAHPRDLRVARWYRWLYVAGALWLAWFAFYYLWPSVKVIGGWALTALTQAPPASVGWWEAVVITLLAMFDLLLPVYVLVRDRRARR